jgi:hypothetical protein
MRTKRQLERSQQARSYLVHKAMCDRFPQSSSDNFRDVECPLWVIFDRSCGLRLPLDVRSSPKATYLLRGNEMR